MGEGRGRRHAAAGAVGVLERRHWDRRVGGGSTQQSRGNPHLVDAEGLLQRDARPLRRQLRRRQLRGGREA